MALGAVACVGELPVAPAKVAGAGERAGPEEKQPNEGRRGRERTEKHGLLGRNSRRAHLRLHVGCECGLVNKHIAVAPRLEERARVGRIAKEDCLGRVGRGEGGRVFGPHRADGSAAASSCATPRSSVEPSSVARPQLW